MGESIVSVAGGTEFGRNTDEEHFEHFTALFATKIELGNHLLYGRREKFISEDMTGA